VEGFDLDLGGPSGITLHEVKVISSNFSFSFCVNISKIKIKIKFYKKNYKRSINFFNGSDIISSYW
jgi:hypothetical protein